MPRVGELKTAGVVILGDPFYLVRFPNNLFLVVQVKPVVVATVECPAGAVVLSFVIASGRL
jgi:hypothetical protein